MTFLALLNGKQRTFRLIETGARAGWIAIKDDRAGWIPLRKATAAEIAELEAMQP